MSHPSHVGTPDWLTLDTGEKVWVRARPSKNLLLVTFVIGTVLLLGVGLVALLFTVDVDTARTASFAILLFIFVLTAGMYLWTQRYEYVVTSHRICEAVGLASKHVSEVDLNQVREVTVEQSGWQRRLNIGELRFVTESDETVRFAFVENPQWTYERVLESVDNFPGSV